MMKKNMSESELISFLLYLNDWERTDLWLQSQ